MKKTILTILLSAFIFSGLFALPGFKSYIQDISGEYVYYRDSTFSRESYVGILTYDESSFQIRYYAPEDKVKGLEAKEIALLLTIDPAANHWEMTGERILSQLALNNEDVDVVNYLHDILYEFSARRGKKDNVSTEILNVKESYEQFGGDVTITYNSLIPLFNIQTITSGDGIPVLQCVTIGNLKNSEDPSFENFKGIPLVTGEKKNTAKVKKAKAVEYAYQNHTVTLDKKWTQKMDNLWVYGNDAILSISALPKYADDVKLNKIYILRKLLESRDSAYIDFESAFLDISDDNRISLKFNTFQQDPNNLSNNQIIMNYKILNANKEGGFEYFTLTAYLPAFNAKFNYFNKIIMSYK